MEPGEGGNVSLCYTPLETFGNALWRRAVPLYQKGKHEMWKYIQHRTYVIASLTYFLTVGLNWYLHTRRPFASDPTQSELPEAYFTFPQRIAVFTAFVLVVVLPRIRFTFELGKKGVPSAPGRPQDEPQMNVMASPTLLESDPLCCEPEDFLLRSRKPAAE